MKKIFVAMLMGLFIFGGTASINVCSASGSQDIVQWYNQKSLMLESIGSTISVTKDFVAYLMDEGYAPRDIVMAGLLAGRLADQNPTINTHVNAINEILVKKTSSNTWQDIANDMGVDQDTYNQYASKANQIG
ncbi:MAG: hypothetical protein H6Q74_1491 [Firmicutes bacterium]|nr:hypothetical protein [Bacillota bacterium]